jgi:hypothetical protein
MKKKEPELELKFHNPNQAILDIKSNLKKPTYTQVETQKEGRKKNLSFKFKFLHHHRTTFDAKSFLVMFIKQKN